MALGFVLGSAVLGGALLGALSDAATGDLLAGALATASVGLLRDRPGWRRACLAASLCLLAAANAAHSRALALDPSLLAWFRADVSGRASSRQPVTIRGRLLEDAERIDDGVRLRIDVVEVEGAGRRHQVRGTVQAFVGGSFSESLSREWTAGRAVRAPAILREPQSQLNPGGPSRRTQALKRPFCLTATIKSGLLVTTRRDAPGDELASHIRQSVRDRAARAFARTAGPSGAQSAAVVTAILIGDREGLDPDLEARLQRAGTYHLLAISGGNVALFAALVLVSARAVSRSFRGTTVVVACAVLAYGWVVSGDASVSRAVTAALVYLTLGVAGLSMSASKVWLLTAVITVLRRPLTVIDGGAWLSFGATLGIILLAGVYWKPIVQHSRPTGWRGTLVKFAAGAFLTTVAAELAVLPIQAELFARVGVAGLALNLIAIPAMAVVEIAGGAAVLLDTWWNAASGVAVVLAHAAVFVLVDSARLVDAAPWLSWRVPPPSGALVVVFYASLGGVALCRALPRLARRLVAAGFVLCTAAVTTSVTVVSHRPASGWLRVTLVDVGQGDSVLLQLPTGQSLLVDAGGAPTRFDVGDRVVTPALWALGVRRIDWLAFTHADVDHVGGATTVMQTFRPREIWEGVPVLPDSRRRALHQLARANGTAWRTLQRGDVMSIGDVTLTTLSPPSPDWERQRVRNDDSIVLRVQYGDVEFLLTGDVSADIERSLPLGDDRDMRPVRVLKVAHHGSRTSSSLEFLERYRPRVALVSAGRSNPFGHPAPDVLRRLGAAGARVFRTDLHGAVTLETDGRELRVRPMEGAPFTLRVVRD